MSAHQSNPEPEARSCIRCMWPLREECFSSLFTLKAVYFYSILWAALQDSIMFSSLTRILTQINKFSVFVSCIRHYSNSLNLKLENLKEQKPDRVNATVCFCEGRQISTPHKCLALGMTSSGPPAEGLSGGREETVWSGMGWDGGLAFWMRCWWGDREHTQTPPMVGLVWRSKSSSIMQCHAAQGSQTCRCVKGPSREQTHTWRCVWERQSNLILLQQYKYTTICHASTAYLKYWDTERVLNNEKVSLLMEIKYCNVLAAQPVYGHLVDDNMG